MEFKKIAEEVDVTNLSSQKENISKQLETVTQQDEAELQKAITAIRNKYANMKQKLSTQISQIDKSVSQEAINLKNNLDQINKEKATVQKPVAPIPVVGKSVINQNITPVSPA